MVHLGDIFRGICAYLAESHMITSTLRVRSRGAEILPFGKINLP